VELAGRHLEGDVPQGDDPGELLADAADRNDGV
jgi:hypothetical protein